MLAKEIDSDYSQNLLDLVAIGTIADMMPLVGVNRSFAKYGLKALKNSNRPGINALFKEAGIDDFSHLSTYHVNFIIAPRLNASRIISA